MLRKYTKRALQRLTANDYRPLNRIELDASAMRHNVALIQEQHAGFAIIPVLKGNAYGHGLEPVARILQDTGCRLLAVDGYFEAAKIRDTTTRRILVMGYILPENAHLLDTKRCSFVIQNIEGLQAFGRLGRPVRVHVELNTGMNRLGLQPDELEDYLQVLRQHPNLHLEGIMTHLADADNELDDSYNRQQVRVFDEQVARILSKGFHPEFIHIAQTAGGPKIHSRHANAIRLGIGTYGINPLLPNDPYHRQLQALRPVLELKSTLIKTLDLQPGETVSYNRTFTAPRAMRVGVLPLGYYEGLPRELSNQGCVTSQGQSLPILGRVCMNHTIIDLRATGLQVNDEVTVISKDSTHPNSAARLQAEHNIFAYSLLTGLSSSVRREVLH